MIKAVFIDVDDTILDFHKSSADAIEKMFRAKGYPFKEDTLEIYHKINYPLWQRVTNGEMTADELKLIRWNEIFKALGIEGDGIEFEEMYKDYLTRTHYLVDGAEELLKYLSSKYKVYAASNAHYEQQRQRLEGAGVLKYLSGIFCSHEIGADKPSKRFFEHCFESIKNTNPSELVMIGDNGEADIKGAHDCGMKTIWFNMRGRYAKPDEADFSVDSLTQIMKIL